MRIKRIRTLGELNDLKPVWQELEATGRSLLFQTWEWNRHWCEVFLAGKRHLRLNVRLIEDGSGRVHAIIPVFEMQLGVVAMSLFLGHQVSVYNDILLRDPEDGELAEQAIDLLLKDSGGRRILHLKHLDQNSLFTRKLLDRGLAELLCTRLWVQADPAITDQSQRLGKRTRKNTRCRENKLSREHGLEFEITSGGPGSEEALAELFTLHHGRFAFLKRRSLLNGPNLEFIGRVVNHPELRHHFEIFRLRTRVGTIAAILVAYDKNACFPLITGFDMKFAAYSPLRLLITETMRRCFNERGLAFYDLGSGYQEYKFRWQPVIGHSYHCCLGFNASARLLSSLYSAAFKRRLPVPPGAIPGGDNAGRTLWPS
jgi:CelD/BcsL family acetyltransferase involved in cellulose biosynthesis